MGRFLIESEQLKKEYAKFIESLGPYIWYCHFTFRYNIKSEERAFSFFIKFIRRLNEWTLGRRYRRTDKRGIFWVMVIERQERGAIHFHFLLKHPLLSKIPCLFGLKIWTNLGKETGNQMVNRIEKFDPKRGYKACKYLTKHMDKGTEIYFADPNLTFWSDDSPVKRNKKTLISKKKA